MISARSLIVALCLSAAPQPLGAPTPAFGLMACALSDPLAPSQIMNAQVIDVLLQVNSGPQLTLAGTGAATKWHPTSSTIAFDPLCQRRGNLRWGPNTVDVWPQEGTAPPSRFIFSIPSSINVQTQFQLYVVWSGETSFRMFVLANGLLLGLVPPS